MVESGHVIVAGTRIHNVTARQVLARADQWLAGKEVPRLICTPNADHCVQARSDDEFRRVLAAADLCVPDGMAVMYAARLLGWPLRERVSGRLLMLSLCGLAADRGYSVFLLGSAPGVARRAAEVLCHWYPNLCIAGTYSPPYGFESQESEVARTVAAVRAAKPDILLVALGTPKQEKFIARNLQALRVPLSMGVGAAFDIVSGQRWNPPRWMTEIGLEWLWKLVQEPDRMWRRYLVRGPLFVALVLRQRLSGRRE